MTSAKLPQEIEKFSGLAAVEANSKHAQKLFTVILLGCLYCWLTIGTTTDVQLFTGGSSWTLPVLGSAIKIAGFYILAPIILLCIYIYLHLYLQRMWRNLAALPARFPDGRPLDERADSWLAVGLVRSHMKSLRVNRPPLSKLQSAIVAILLWCLVPLTIAWFWIRFLTVHEWLWSILHMVTLVGCVGFGVLDYYLARATLRGTPWSKGGWRILIGRRLGTLAIWAAAILFLACAVTVGTITGVPVGKGSIVTSTLPWLYSQLNYDPFADFQEEDVSARPQDWPQQQHASEVQGVITYRGGNYEVVRGAKLRGRNLRYARGVGAFLINADLRGTDLRGADLARADLRGADCTNTDFSGADLRRSTMEGAILVGTDMTEALLDQCDLSKTVFRRVKLARTDFGVVSLPSLKDSCDLRGADLRGIDVILRSEIRTALTDSTTKLPQRIIED